MAVSDRIAVMNEGSVVQEGSARDLYHRPATEFVARFVGRVNLVPARVVAVEGDAVVVDALGTHAACAARGATPCGRRCGVAAAATRGDRDRCRRRRGPARRDRRLARVPRREDRVSRALRRHAAAGGPLQRGPGDVVADGAAVSLRPRSRGDAACGSAAMNRAVLLVRRALPGRSLAPSRGRGSGARPREVHGSADAFATPGIALAWAVLRAAKESDTAVVLRIDARSRDASRGSRSSARIRSRNGEDRLRRRPPSAARSTSRCRARRFADFPRTEIRLWRAGRRAGRHAARRSSSITSAFPTRRRKSRCRTSSTARCPHGSLRARDAAGKAP